MGATRNLIYDGTAYLIAQDDDGKFLLMSTGAVETYNASNLADYKASFSSASTIDNLQTATLPTIAVKLKFLTLYYFDADDDSFMGSERLWVSLNGNYLADEADLRMADLYLDDATSPVKWCKVKVGTGPLSSGSVVILDRKSLYDSDDAAITSVAGAAQAVSG